MTTDNTQTATLKSRLAGVVLFGAFCAASTGAQAQEEADLAAVMNCRAMAIAHAGVADLDEALFGEEATAALREQADFALVSGLWGDPSESVDSATQALRIGENFMINQAQIITQYSKDSPGPQGYSGHLIGCVPIIWNAVEIAINRLMATRVSAEEQ